MTNYSAKPSTSVWLGRAYSIAIMTFLGAPLAMVIILSFSANDYVSFPPTGLSLRWYESIMADSRLVDALVVSLEVAAASTLIAVLVGLPTAVTLVRHPARATRMLQLLTLSPLVLPEVLIALALFVLITSVFRMQSNIFWMVMVHAVIVLPFAIQFLSSALARLSPELEEAARTLGAHPVRAFFAVTIPGIRSGIVSAALLGFIFSFDNVTISLFLSAPGVTTLPVRLYEQAVYSNDLQLAAVSAVLIYAGIFFLLLIGKLRGFDSSTLSSR